MTDALGDKKMNERREQRNARKEDLENADMEVSRRHGIVRNHKIANRAQGAGWSSSGQVPWGT